MNELGNLPVVAAACFMLWCCLCAIIVGHGKADRASREAIEASYAERIAKAANDVDRRMAETSRDLWRASLPPLDKAWP